MLYALRTRFILALLMIFSSFSYGAGSSKIYTQVGPSFIMAGSTTPGINASFLGRITSQGNAYVGVDGGIYFSSGATSSLILPIIPFIVYYFPSRDFLKPWLGFGFGVNLGLGGTTPAVVYFKPGVHFAITKELEGFFECRLGIIGSGVALIPTFGAMFPI